MSSDGGADVAGRKRRSIITAVVVAGSLAAIAVSATGGPTAGREVRGERVVVVLARGLSWECVTPDAMPELTSLVRRSAVGSLSMRTADRQPSTNAVMATIGAGARTSAGFTSVPQFEVGDRSELDDVDRARLDAAADDARYGAVPGLLGSTVHVVLEGADTRNPGAEGLAAMDRLGAVRLDAASTDGSPEVTMVPVDGLGDDGCPADPAAADRRVGEIVRSTDVGRDVVIVVTSSPPTDPEQLGVAAISGPGVGEGSLVSRSTRAPGFVTLPDVAPTVLVALGRAVPGEMNGSPMTVIDSVPTTTAIDNALRDNERAKVRDAAFAWVVAAWAALTVFVLVGGLLVTRRRAAALPVQFLCRWSFALPLVALVATPFEWQALGPGGFWLLVVGGSALVAGLFTAAGSRRDVRIDPLVLAGCTWAVLAFGGTRLQMNGVFGYSPIDGGRFSGFGNQAFVLFSWGAVVLVGLGASRWTDQALKGLGLVAAGAVLGATAVIDGILGADVGGLLTLLPAAVVCLAVVSGRRVRARLLVVGGVVSLGVVAAVAALDARRPPADRTHLGRLFSDLTDGRPPLLFERKLSTMASTLTQPWSVVIIAAVVFFAVRLARPSERSARIERQHPHLRTVGIATLFVATVGALTNDSGLRMTAVFVALGVTYACWFAVAAPNSEFEGPAS